MIFQRHESKSLVFDEHRVNKLLDVAVRLTSDFSVTKLEKMYVAMMRTSDKYASSYDKAALVEARILKPVFPHIRPGIFISQELDNLIRNFGS